MNWLDSFTRTHRLSAYQAAKRSVRVTRRAQQNPAAEWPGNPLPLADTMFILKHGKKAWRAALANAETTAERKE